MLLPSLPAATLHLSTSPIFESESCRVERRAIFPHAAPFLHLCPRHKKTTKSSKYLLRHRIAESLHAMATTSNLFFALAAVLSSNTAAAFFTGIGHHHHHNQLHHHRSRMHITDVVDVIRTPTTRLLVASNRDRSSQRRRSRGNNNRQTGRGGDGYSTYDAFGRIVVRW